MARTALTPTRITIAGITPTLTAANADGHSIPTGDGIFIDVTNGSGAPINVTIVTPITVGSRAVPDDVIAVPAAGTRRIGGFQRDVHGQASGADRGKAYIDFSAVTSVTVGAFTT